MKLRPLHDRVIIERVAVGDKILLNKWAGAEIKHEGKELLIVKESDIIAIV